ncbi:MAG: hypothetical protein ABIH99_01930 [Candidatus Micrarchaeota archaeon]
MAFIGTLLKIARFLVLLALAGSLAVSIPILLLVWNAKSTVLNPEVYKATFENQKLYSKLQDAIVNGIADNIDLESVASNVGSNIEIDMSKDEMKERIDSILTTKWIKLQVNSLLDNGLGYLTSKKEKLELTVSLRELKENLVNEVEVVAREKINDRIDDLRTQNPRINQIMQQFGCDTLEDCEKLCEQAQFKEYCDQMKEELGISNMVGSGDSTSLIKAQLQEEVSKAVPDSVDLTEALKKDPAISKQLEEGRRYMGIGILITDLALLVPLVLIILIGIVTHEVKSGGRWVGIPLILGGLSTSVLGFGVPMLASNSIKSIASPEPALAEFVAIAKGIAIDLVNAIFGSMLWQGIVILLIGGALLALSIAVSLLFRKK